MQIEAITPLILFGISLFSGYLIVAPTARRIGMDVFAQLAAGLFVVLGYLICSGLLLSKFALITPTNMLLSQGAFFGAAMAIGSRDILTRRRDSAYHLLLLIPAAMAGLYGLFFLLNPGSVSSISWYYLHEIRTISLMGTVPDTAINFGAPMAFEVNKIGTQMILVHWLALAWNLRPDVIVAAITIVFCFIFGLGVMGVLRRLEFSVWQITKGTVAAYFIPLVTLKLFGFHGDSFGIALILLAATLFEFVLQDPRKALWIIFGTSLTVIALAHISTVVVLAIWMAARLTVSCDKHILLRTVSAGLLAVALLLATWASLGRNPLLVQDSMLTPTTEQTTFKADTTHLYYQTAMGHTWDKIPKEPYKEKDIVFEFGDRLRKGFGVFIRDPWGIAMTLAYLIMILSAFITLRVRPKYALSTVTFGTALLIWSAGFLLIGNQDIMRGHGFRRELPYIQLWFIPCLAFFLLKLPTPKPMRRILTMSLYIGFIALGVYRLQSTADRSPRISKHGHAAYEFIQQNAGPDARFIADGTSDAIFGFLSGKVSLLEGRSAYFQEANLKHALTQIKKTQDFFAGKPDKTWLHEQKPQFLITGSEHLGLRRLRGLYLESDPESLLQEIFRSGPVVIYEIRPSRPVTSQRNN